MKKNVFLIALLFFAIFVRFYKLGSIPHGITWDEAAIGYNGYAIFVNGTDEWLQPWPVSFRSFGDYKAPLAIYLNGVSTHFFGLNPWAVRLPFAMSGVGTVILFYFFLKTLYRDSQHTEVLSCIGAASIAFSPWHIHFSRIGFESGISLLLLVASVYTLLFFAKNTSLHKRRHSIFLALSMILAIASMYAYHSAKITTPLVYLTTIVLFIKKKEVEKNWRWYTVIGIFGLVLSWPLLQDSVYGGGASRAAVLIFNEHLGVTEYVKIIFSNIPKIFSLDFLIDGKVDTLRHGSGEWGILLPISYVLFLFGVGHFILLLWKKRYGSSFKISLFSSLFLFFGILPALITREPMHPNRTLLALPGFLLLSVQGVAFLLFVLQRYISSPIFKNILLKITSGLFLCIFLFSFFGYWQYYRITFSKESATAFQDGYLESFSIAEEYATGKNGKPLVKKILFSNEYGQAYIFGLFVKKSHPLWYQAGSLGKYEFTNKITDADLQRKATLVVATQHNLLDTVTADHVVYGSDGKIRFALYLSKGTE